MEQSLSTLVHEMTHLEQHHFGTPSRTGYHNREWAGMMLAVGLVPSDTGAPGGKQTGQHMTHYIEPGGAFAHAVAALVARGFDPFYVERWAEGGGASRPKKAANKLKYTCPGCGANAWGKPQLHLICGDCAQRMDGEEE